MSRIRFLKAVFLLCICLVAGASHAVQRAYVSAISGNDSNTATGCPASAPCRWFYTAITVVDPGGEIVAMDSGAYGALTVDRSVAITAAPGAYGGITVFAGSGIIISAPSLKVTLRGLTINGLGGSQGILVSSAGSTVSVENCVIGNFSVSGYGIQVSGSSTLRVVDTLFRDNYVALGVSGGATANVSRSEFYGNSSAGVSATSTSSGQATRVGISDLVASGNGTAVFAGSSAAGASTLLTITNSVVTNNTVGLSQTASGGGTATLESLGNNAVRQNTTNTSGSISTFPLL